MYGVIVEIRSWVKPGVELLLPIFCTLSEDICVNDVWLSG